MIGYFGSLLVVVSMLMSSVIKLRVINTIGSSIFAVYALIIHSYPTAVMNFCLVAINIYNLIRLQKTDKHYDLIDGKIDDRFLAYILNYYKNDMKEFFPEVHLDTLVADTAYIVCSDATPAGLLLGKESRKGELEVILDYSTPTYRDCSVGNYLYSQLSTKGIHSLVYAGKSQKHEPYLKKMGFVKENEKYIKNL